MLMSAGDGRELAGRRLLRRLPAAQHLPPLFGEGAFSAGFVPLFSQRLHGEAARSRPSFSEEVLAVFLPTLVLFTLCSRSSCRRSSR
jgi:putative peptidoglycan lipid II flippase